MTTKKRIGIWMDHSSANLIEFTAAAAENENNETNPHHVKAAWHDNSDSAVPHQQAEYFKELGGVIKDYDEVLLFGPTGAKSELHNILKGDHHFDKITIEVKQTDKMTENQQHAFVKTHFTL